VRKSTLLLIVALGLSAALFSLNETGANEAYPVDAYGTAQPRSVDFATQIQPILSTRCMPCHFQGGIMYERLPFDQPKTITTLGENLFTRIRNEDERRLIRQFLAQPSG
jgi:hypothetical protein